MSNFKKIIQKIVRGSTNCLAVNVPYDDLEVLIEIFDCVFVLDHEKEIYRHRSLVYRESYDSLGSLPDIKLIMCNEKELINFSKFLPIIGKTKPDFCILQGTHIKPEYSKELLGVGYMDIHKRKHFQFWRHRGKNKK